MAVNKRSFFKLCVSTLVAVYFLILVGGIVRSTGSGMGCPDWPKCFGQWIPPASQEELPENYKEIYSGYRDSKNKRFVKYLNVLGFKDTASRILSDESIREEADFNAVKTWIEYINRLVGVIIGLMIFAVFIASLRFWKERRAIFVTSLFLLLLVGFQGWIGSFVVSTNLTPWTVTVHMFLALAIVAVLVYLVYQGRENSSAVNVPYLFWWLLACMAILMVQVLFGTRVRESIDRVADLMPRDAWISNLGTEFFLHRSFSWIILLLHAGLVYNVYKAQALKRYGMYLMLLVIFTIMSGTGMAYLAVPPVLQPVHLLLATLTFGFQMYLLLHLSRRKDSPTVQPI